MDDNSDGGYIDGGLDSKEKLGRNKNMLVIWVFQHKFQYPNGWMDG